MTDSTLIWKAMAIIIPDYHPAVYIYVKGQIKSKEGAINRVVKEVYPLFEGAFDVSKIKKVSKEFLNIKREEYRRGDIKIKSIH